MQSVRWNIYGYIGRVHFEAHFFAPLPPLWVNIHKKDSEKRETVINIWAFFRKMFNFAYGLYISGLQGRSGKRFRGYVEFEQKALGRKFSVSKSPKYQTVSELLSESAHFLYQANWRKFSHVGYRRGMNFFKFYLQRCLAIPETEGLEAIRLTPFIV